MMVLSQVGGGGEEGEGAPPHGHLQHESLPPLHGRGCWRRFPCQEAPSLSLSVSVSVYVWSVCPCLSLSVSMCRCVGVSSPSPLSLSLRLMELADVCAWDRMRHTSRSTSKTSTPTSRVARPSPKPCCSLLCYRCYAMQCDTMLCDVILCFAMPYYALLSQERY